MIKDENFSFQVVIILKLQTIAFSANCCEVCKCLYSRENAIETLLK